MRSRFPQPFSWPRTPDRYVYHYTKAETALTKILPTKTIRAGRFTTMNDPREAKHWIFGCPDDTGAEFDLSGAQRLESRANKAASYIQENLRVVAFSRDDFGRNGNDDENPLGRGFGLPSMWAHYGRLHSGMCLIFDRAKLEERVRDYIRETREKRPNDRFAYWADAVSYEDRRNDGSDEEIEKHSAAFIFDIQDGFASYRDAELHHEAYRHVCKHYRDLVLKKGLDWSYENEYRWVFWDEGRSDVLIDFGNALAGIVVTEDFGTSNELGAVAQPFYNSLLSKYRSELKVDAYELFWANGYPFLDRCFDPKEKKFRSMLESAFDADGS